MNRSSHGNAVIAVIGLAFANCFLRSVASVLISGMVYAFAAFASFAVIEEK
jgi:hypothetical protein